MHLLLSAVCLGAAVAVALAAVPPSDQILQYLKSRGEISESALPSPLKVVYIDWRDVNWNAPDQNVKDIVNGGYNVVILAFYLTSGPTDMLQAYAGLPNSTKESVQAFVHSAGAVLLLSAGGSSSVPFSQDPAVFGAAAARFAAENYLDGVDFDIENLDVGCLASGLSAEAVVQWLVTLTTSAKAAYPSGFVTHAPQAPYFSQVQSSSDGASFSGPNNPWAGPTGCYSGVYKKLKPTGALSWFNLQFYNQGVSCYLTYESLFLASNGTGACPSFPGTSVSEIVGYGVDESAIVIGKPLLSSDAGSGYVPPLALHGILANATSHGFRVPGVFAWSWETTEGPKWIQTVYPPK